MGFFNLECTVKFLILLFVELFHSAKLLNIDIPYQMNYVCRLTHSVVLLAIDPFTPSRTQNDNVYYIYGFHYVDSVCVCMCVHMMCVCVCVL